LPDGKGGKLCPICDSPLEPGSKKCGFCGTDLAIFETEAETESSKADEKVASDALDNKLEEVFFGPGDDAQTAKVDAEPEPPIAEEPVEQPSAEPEPTPEPEARVEAESAALAEVAEPVVEHPPEPAEPKATVEEHFECPQCGSHVLTTASSCPSCGVMFADEGVDMFQCPACNSLVNIDATSCPGCGALFVDSEEAAAAEQTPATYEPKPELEQPVSEVVVEPESDEVAEAEAEKGAGKKGLFGSIFSKKKKRKRELEEAEDEAEVEPETEHDEEEPESVLSRRRAPGSEPAPIPTQELVEPEVKDTPATEESVARRKAAEPEQAVKAPQPAAAPKAMDKPKAKELARLTAEMQPLMRLASDNGIDVSESRRLVDEGAMSARAREIDRAFEKVVSARDLLMKNLTESIGQLIDDLNEEVSVAKALGGDVSRTSTYLDALAKANSSGDFEAVYVYAGKVKNELLPITGRYNESKQKLNTLRALISDSEMIAVNTKETRLQLVEATKSFEANDFDNADATVRSATKKLYAMIEPRMEDEIRRARNQLVEVKAKGMNITPMITVLKSARTLMKAKDYQQALKEMREFKEQLEKAL
jgi:cellobiose-specific phosphotransferase system component IIA